MKVDTLLVMDYTEKFFVTIYNFIVYSQILN